VQRKALTPTGASSVMFGTVKKNKEQERTTERTTAAIMIACQLRRKK